MDNIFKDDEPLPEPKKDQLKYHYIRGLYDVLAILTLVISFIVIVKSSIPFKTMLCIILILMKIEYIYLLKDRVKKYLYTKAIKKLQKEMLKVIKKGV